MSMQNHLIAGNIDKIIQATAPSIGDDYVQSPKDVISNALSIKFIKELSLPTAVVANIDQYWWDTHHEQVRDAIAKVNEVYPIHVQQIMVRVKTFYKIRYQLAFAMTLDLVDKLVSNYRAKEDPNVAGADTHGFDCSNMATSQLIITELDKIIGE